MLNYLKNIFSKSKQKPNQFDWSDSDIEDFTRWAKRKSAVARVGGFRPTNELGKSRMAGDFVMRADEEWPSLNGKYLDSILQINIDELSIVPERLKPFKLVTFFVSLDAYENSCELENNFVIRAYKTLEGLEVRPSPVANHLKSFEMDWAESIDTPCHEDVMSFGIAIERSFSASDLFDKLNLDNYLNWQTKVGGWPALIQHELDMPTESFVFQVGSEEKVHLNWTDNGVVYVGYDNGVWKEENQFY